jgi:hypothetical protein
MVDRAIARVVEAAMDQHQSNNSKQNFLREYYWHLELARDQRHLAEINILIFAESLSEPSPNPLSALSQGSIREFEMARDILCESLAQNFQQSLRIAENLWLLQTHPETRIFALNWAITNCEDLCNFKERNKWMKCWAQVEGWMENPWALFLYQFHQAVGFYFAGSLREALSLFEKCAKLAENIHYQRGHYRSLLHIGLCNFYLRRRECAIQNYQACEKLACELGALTMIHRVQNELSGLRNGFFGSPYKQQILHGILNKNLKSAISIFLRESSNRRANNLPREAESDIAFLAVILFAKNKNKSFNWVINRISDLYVLEKVLYFLIQNFKNTETLRIKLKLLHELLDMVGIEIKSDGAFFNQHKIVGAEAGTDIFKFLQLLKCSSSEGASKEEICKMVWQLDYDPIIHDPRIYKLVNRAKTAIGSEDVIINMRGSYRLAN